MFYLLTYNCTSSVMLAFNSLNCLHYLLQLFCCSLLSLLDFSFLFFCFEISLSFLFLSEYYSLTLVLSLPLSIFLSFSLTSFPSSNCTPFLCRQFYLYMNFWRFFSHFHTANDYSFACFFPVPQQFSSVSFSTFLFLLLLRLSNFLLH